MSNTSQFESARRLAAVLALVGLQACSEPPSPPAAEQPAAQNAQPDAVPGGERAAVSGPAENPLRDVFYGDLHVHTSWSTDAYAGGNRVGPDDAYRFARGEAVELPSGIVTQLEQPLDFVAITDHAEGFDAIAACTYPDHPQYDSDACRNMRSPTQTQAAYLAAAFKRGTARPAQRDPALCADEAQCLANARSTWQREQALANRFNEPGRFTALIGYEFSSLLPEFGMLHRNVIFRGSDVIPHAISSLDVNGQADFFEKLDAACELPCQVLTIPHNTNYSWGKTFARTDEDGSAYTTEDLERRSRIDRLVEVTQEKGTSECQIGVGAADEDCNFGMLFPPCEPGQEGRCATEASFVRNALLDGILMASEGRTDPFALGMIGSTDTHQSDPGNTSAERPSRYARMQGNAQATRQVFEQVHPVVGLMRRTSTGGLAGVWALSNTREELFDAMRRRETFATSGSRLRIRFFAGQLPGDLSQRDDALSRAYELGVPMGGVVRDASTLSFWVTAQQDPAGPSLDRIQVIKGWVEDGEKRERVWDVACSGDRKPDTGGRCGPTTVAVDPATCEAGAGSAASELATMFTDPDFDPLERAFYYVRVMENPSCRWTTWMANAAGIAPPDDVPATVQQRGWSSPIWIEPAPTGSASVNAGGR